GQTTPPHGFRLIRERYRVARGPRITLRVVRTVVLDRVHVDRGDPAVLAEAHLHARKNAGAGAADEVLLFARDAHHHGRVRLLREQGGNRHRDGARNLAAETAARVL